MSEPNPPVHTASGAGQNRYQPWLLSGSFWQGFAILFPEQPKLAVFQQGANVQDVLRAYDSPEHARLLKSQADDGFTTGFDHSGANEQASCQILGVTHLVDVAFEVG